VVIHVLILVDNSDSTDNKNAKKHIIHGFHEDELSRDFEKYELFVSQNIRIVKRSCHNKKKTGIYVGKYDSSKTGVGCFPVIDTYAIL
jgi:hypothetical protein